MLVSDIAKTWVSYWKDMYYIFHVRFGSDIDKIMLKFALNMGKVGLKYG